MSAGELLTFTFYGLQLGEKTGQMMDNWGILKAATGASARVFELIDDGVAQGRVHRRPRGVVLKKDAEAYVRAHYPQVAAEIDTLVEQNKLQLQSAAESAHSISLSPSGPLSRAQSLAGKKHSNATDDNNYSLLGDDSKVDQRGGYMRSQNDDVKHDTLPEGIFGNANEPYPVSGAATASALAAEALRNSLSSNTFTSRAGSVSGSVSSSGRSGSGGATAAARALQLRADTAPWLRFPLQFHDVHFAYPTRLNKTVLKGLSLTLEPGQVTALVGTSGGGKSTIVALIERFYEPLRGSVTWGGVPIECLDMAWWHRQVRR